MVTWSRTITPRKAAVAWLWSRSHVPHSASLGPQTSSTSRFWAPSPHHPWFIPADSQSPRGQGTDPRGGNRAAPGTLRPPLGKRKALKSASPDLVLFLLSFPLSVFSSILLVDCVVSLDAAPGRLAKMYTGYKCVCFYVCVYIYTQRQVAHGLLSKFDCRCDREGSKDWGDLYQLKIWSICCNIPHAK